MAGEIEIEAIPKAEPDIDGLVRCLLLYAAEVVQRQSAEDDADEVSSEENADGD